MTPSADASPLLAPDRLSVWPLDGERYGLDGTYQGTGGYERAEAQRRRLKAARLPVSLRQETTGAWTLRLGPLTHTAAWLAIEAFIGTPGARLR